jgi:hypothetical protein
MRIFSLVILIGLLFACNGKESNYKESPELQSEVKSLNAKASEQVWQQIEKAQQRGDTIVLNPDSLIQLLPVGFPGYALTDTQHQYIYYNRIALSEAEMGLTNQEFDLTLSLVDFNSSRKTWFDIYELYHTDYHQDTEQEFACAWSPGVGEQFAWYSRLKDADFTTIKLGFSSRFVLTLEINTEADTLMMREVLRSADWSQLIQTNHD